jgi:hypothetical protein
MKYFAWILILISIGLAFFVGKCSNKEVSQNDTIYLKPDTVRFIDTIFFPKNVVKWLPGKPVYIPIRETDTTKTYEDSLIDENVKIFVREMITSKGELTGRDLGYTLFVPKEIIKTEKITIPLFIQPKEYKFYWQGGLGYNAKKVIISAELGTFKKRNLIGVQYLRYSEYNFLLIKYGLKF